MKKLLPFLLSLALIAIFSDSKAQEFKKGLKAGANFATLSGDDVGSPDNIISYHAGFFTRFTFTKIGIQAEALFSSQGAEYDGDKSTLTYLHVPVLGRINFVAGKLGIYLGPQFGYLLSAKNDFDLPEGVDDKDLYTDLDVSGVVGAELDVAAGLIVGARYYQSLSSISEGYEYDETTVINGVSNTSSVSVSAGDVKNSVFQVYVGYAF